MGGRLGMAQEAPEAVLARLREESGKSQVALGASSGFDRSYVSRVEAGLRNPTRDFLEAASVALNLTAGQDWELMAAFGYTPSRSKESVQYQDAEDLLFLLYDPEVPWAAKSTAQIMVREAINHMRMERREAIMGRAS